MSKVEERKMSRIEGIVKTDVEPIKNPATGEEHRARIVLPNGFEYKEAEMGNTVDSRVSAGDKLTFELKNSYAQLNTSIGTTDRMKTWPVSSRVNSPQ
jgi:hypothetical protein